MRINLSPIHSDRFSTRPLSSALCAQSYHVAASRASGGASRHGAGLLLIPAAIGRDVSPWTVRGLRLLTDEKIFAAEVVCGSRASRITVESRSDGYYALEATC